MQTATQDRDEFWNTYIQGNQSGAHAELADALRVPSDESVLCNELINQSWLLRTASRILPGNFDFDSGSRLIVTDKRILISKYGGLSSWFVQNVPVRFVSAFFRELNVSGNTFVIDTDAKKFSFEVSRKALPIVERAMSLACPRAGSAENMVKSILNMLFYGRCYWVAKLDDDFVYGKDDKKVNAARRGVTHISRRLAAGGLSPKCTTWATNLREVMEHYLQEIEKELADAR